MGLGKLFPYSGEGREEVPAGLLGKLLGGRRPYVVAPVSKEPRPWAEEADDADEARRDGRVESEPPDPDGFEQLGVG